MLHQSSQSIILSIYITILTSIWNAFKYNSSVIHIWLKKVLLKYFNSTVIHLESQITLHCLINALKHAFTHPVTPLSDRMMSKMECVFLYSLNLSHFILPTFGNLLSLLPLQLEVPHDGGGGGDGGGRG